MKRRCWWVQTEGLGGKGECQGKFCVKSCAEISFFSTCLDDSMSDSSEETAVEMNEISAVPIASETEENPFDSTTANGSGLTKHAAPHGAPKKNSLCYDIFMPILVVSLLASGIIVILVANNWRANDPKEIAKIYHEKHPYIDGKNQLPYAIKYVPTFLFYEAHKTISIGAYKAEKRPVFVVFAPNRFFAAFSLPLFLVTLKMAGNCPWILLVPETNAIFCFKSLQDSV